MIEVILRTLSKYRLLSGVIIILYGLAFLSLFFSKRNVPSYNYEEESHYVAAPRTTRVPSNRFPHDPNSSKNPLIFVSLASFRDPYCMITLQDMYKNADHPENLRVGITQQNDAQMDVDCLSISSIDEKSTADMQTLINNINNIRILRMRWQDAKGPTWARWKTFDEHYRGEDYVLQIDSHIMFRKGWDTALINDIRMLPPKSTLSHYPHVWEVGKGPQEGSERTVPVLCSGNYDDNHILKPGGGIIPIESSTYPREQPFMAAGFSFYPAYVHDEVPLDPHLPNLFHGEEVLFSYRVVSRGWRIYSPTRNNLYHFYYRKDFPKYWDKVDQEWHDTHRRSIQRVKYLMGYFPRFDVEQTSKTLVEERTYGIDWDDPEVDANIQRYLRRWEINLLEKTAGDFCGRDPPKWP